MSWVSLKKLRGENPSTEGLEFKVPDHGVLGMVGMVDDDPDDLVWVTAVLDRTAIIQRDRWADREQMRLERLQVRDEDVKIVYLEIDRLILGFTRKGATVGRKRALESKRRNIAAKKTARGQDATAA